MTSEVVTTQDLIVGLIDMELPLYKRSDSDVESVNMKEITALGVHVLNIEETNRQLSAMPWQYLNGRYVTDSYLVRDYHTSKAFSLRIRPAALVWFPEDLAGVRPELDVVDYLLPASDEVAHDKYGNEGKVLNPEEYTTAIYKLYCKINRKCKQVASLQPVDRKILVMNRELVQEYPTVINGQVSAYNAYQYNSNFIIANPGVYKDDCYRDLTAKDRSNAVLKWLNVLYDDANSFEAQSAIKQEDIH